MTKPKHEITTICLVRDEFYTNSEKSEFMVAGFTGSKSGRCYYSDFNIIYFKKTFTFKMYNVYTNEIVYAGTTKGSQARLTSMLNVFFMNNPEKFDFYDYSLGDNRSNEKGMYKFES